MPLLLTSHRPLLAGAFLLLASLLGAQQVPPVPPDGIRDDARTMSTEARAALVVEMKAFEQRTGILIVIDTNTFLEQGLSTLDRSRALLKEWVGQRPGVVFCLNRGVKPLPMILFTKELWERYPEPDLNQATGETLESMGKLSSPESRMPVGVRVLMNRLTALEKAAKLRNQLFHRRDLKLAAAYAGVLFVISLLTVLLVRRSHRDEAIEAVKHEFPEVEVAQRFGAPNGGGVIVEVSYSVRH